jgi:hypothetical protein
VYGVGETRERCLVLARLLDMLEEGTCTLDMAGLVPRHRHTLGHTLARANTQTHTLVVRE